MLSDCALRDGDIYDVEGTGADCALLNAERGWLAPTNHIRDRRLRQVEWGDLLNSKARLRRVERLLQHAEGRTTIDGLWSILSDHSNAPKSVCKHLHPEHNPHIRTVAGVVLDLTAGELHIGAGYPRETTTTTVRLAA